MPFFRNLLFDVFHTYQHERLHIFCLFFLYHLIASTAYRWDDSSSYTTKSHSVGNRRDAIVDVQECIQFIGYNIRDAMRRRRRRRKEADSLCRWTDDICTYVDGSQSNWNTKTWNSHLDMREKRTEWRSCGNCNRLLRRCGDRKKVRCEMKENCCFVRVGIHNNFIISLNLALNDLSMYFWRYFKSVYLFNKIKPLLFFLYTNFWKGNETNIQNVVTCLVFCKDVFLIRSHSLFSIFHGRLHNLIT